MMFVMFFSKENKIKRKICICVKTFIRILFELSVLQYHFYSTVLQYHSNKRFNTNKFCCFILFSLLKNMTNILGYVIKKLNRSI
jgi:hypothetical protein